MLARIFCVSLLAGTLLWAAFGLSGRPASTQRQDSAERYTEDLPRCKLVILAGAGLYDLDWRIYHTINCQYVRPEFADHYDDPERVAALDLPAGCELPYCILYDLDGKERRRASGDQLHSRDARGIWKWVMTDDLRRHVIDHESRRR